MPFCGQFPSTTNEHRLWVGDGDGKDQVGGCARWGPDAGGPAGGKGGASTCSRPGRPEAKPSLRPLLTLEPCVSCATGARCLPSPRRSSRSIRCSQSTEGPTAGQHGGPGPRRRRAMRGAAARPRSLALRPCAAAHPLPGGSPFSEPAPP